MLVAEQEKESKESKSGTPSTTPPPKTLPADFDFKSNGSISALSSPSAPPKTLPANFDFGDKQPPQTPQPTVSISAAPHESGVRKAWNWLWGIGPEYEHQGVVENILFGPVKPWEKYPGHSFGERVEGKIQESIEKTEREGERGEISPTVAGLRTFTSGVGKSGTRMARGATEPKNLALGATAILVPPTAPFIATYYAVQGGKEAIKGHQQGETLADELERRLGGAGQAFLAGAGTVGGLPRKLSVPEYAKWRDSQFTKVEGKADAATGTPAETTYNGKSGRTYTEAELQAMHTALARTLKNAPLRSLLSRLPSKMPEFAKWRDSQFVQRTDGTWGVPPHNESFTDAQLHAIYDAQSTVQSSVAQGVKAAVTRPIKNLQTKLESGVQQAAGTGTRMVEKVTEKKLEGIQADNTAELEKSAKAQEKFAEDQKDYDTKISRINEDFDHKIKLARDQYADDVAARDKKVSEIQAKHADAVAEARRDWVQKTYEARQANRVQAKVEGQREALKSAQKSYSDLVKENVNKAHANTRAALDSRWNQLREQVGTEHPVNPHNIYEAVEKSRAMLAGVPADLKIFNDVFKEITEPDTHIESPDGPKPAPREYITFDNARTQYSAVGEKAYAAEGNLRRALFNVYDAYDKALSKTATDAGAGKQYVGIKKDWSQYMKDWHDMSGAATGGSPLARLYRAVDNPVVTAHVTGKFGDRLFGTFARYDKYGANPALMSKLRNSTQELAALPKPKAPKSEPGKFESPAEPKIPEPVESPTGKETELEHQRAKAIERTEPPVPVKPPELKPNPTVDEMVDTVRRAKEEKAKDFAAKQKWHTYDPIMASWVAFGIPDAAIHGALSRATVHAAMYLGARVGWMKFIKSPTGMKWMTEVTPADMEMIQKVMAKYPDQKVEISGAIESAIEDQVKAGGPTPNISKFKGVLSPKQTADVLKAVESVKSRKSSPKSSAEAGGSGTAAGAAADNQDLAQARINLGLKPGEFRNDLLAEAQKIKDARLAKGKQSYSGPERRNIPRTVPPTDQQMADFYNARFTDIRKQLAQTTDPVERAELEKQYEGLKRLVQAKAKEKQSGTSAGQ